MRNNTFLHYYIITFLIVFPLASFAATIETDRTWYLAGEVMKVSITDDDAQIAYTELCDTQGLTTGIVVGLQQGKGSGIIELPANLHSGYYVLSAYTRHSVKVNHQLVAIVNPLHKSVDDAIEWVKVTHPDSLSYPSASEPFSAADMAEKKEVGVRETEGHIIKARVKNVNDGHSFSSSQIRPSIGIVGKQIHYFEGKMVNDSTAVFYTYDIHGKQPLVLSAVTSTGVSLPIELISPFVTLLPKKLPQLVFHYNRSEVEARSIDMQRHQMAITPAKRELQIGVLDDGMSEEAIPLEYDETLYGAQPYLSYNLDEYRQFLSIREVLVEYVNCVGNRKVNDVTQLVVHTDLDSYMSSWPSLVLIDGMPVINMERLLNYDARRVHYINIYGGQYTFGHGIYNGILSFVSRSGRLTNYPTEPNMQYLVYDFP